MNLAIRNNAKLSRATFFVSTADYLVFFSILSVLLTEYKDIYIAAYSVSIKSIGVAIGAVAFPYLGSRFSPKKVLVFTIGIISLVLFLMLYIVASKISPTIIYLIFFIYSFLGQIFMGLRESLSKSYGTSSQQRGLQSQILSSFYSSQIVGPVLGFIFGFYHLPKWAIFTAVIFNSLSLFFIRGLPDSEVFPNSKVFRPFSYLKIDMPLTQIFILRSVLQWIPISLYNFLIFPVVDKQYKLSGIYSAWIFVAVAIGSTLVSLIFNPAVSTSKSLLNMIHARLSKVQDYKLAFVAMIAMALVRLLLLYIPSLKVFLVIAMIGGVASSLNAISTQTIRRKLCDPRQHPEIVGLESIVGRFVDWLVGSICAYLLIKGHISYHYGIIFSAVFLIAISFIILQNKFKSSEGT